jgi:hypothetical protein
MYGTATELVLTFYGSGVHRYVTRHCYYYVFILLFKYTVHKYIVSYMK